MPTTRYVLIGGFLGAGKTTAVLALARHLTNEGHRVGIIANDQSDGLVDTARMRADGHLVEEITGGCFCCRFDALVDSSFAVGDGELPDVLVAEPVGSCTDLQATVTYPLRERFGDDFTLAPFSVLVDPARCASFLGLWGRYEFSEKVAYVYGKQLEEAEIIVVHKSDMLSGERRNQLIRALQRSFPAATVLAASSLSGEGVTEWYEHLLTSELGRGPSLEIDYDLYADGEALLGWVNVRGTIESDVPVDGDSLLIDLCRDLAAHLRSLGIAVAHLKVTLADGELLGSVSVTDSEGPPMPTAVLGEEVPGGELIVNLRAEGDPEVLHDALIRHLEALPHRYRTLDEAAFRPGRPVPTHRLGADGQEIART